MSDIFLAWRWALGDQYVAKPAKHVKVRRSAGGNMQLPQQSHKTYHSRGEEATNTLLPWRNCAFLRLSRVISNPLPSDSKRMIDHKRPDASL